MILAVVISITVLVVVVIVPGFGSVRVNPAVLYGRWVKNGDACDTKLGNMVIGAATASPAIWTVNWPCG